MANEQIFPALTVCFNNRDEVVFGAEGFTVDLLRDVPGGTTYAEVHVDGARVENWVKVFEDGAESWVLTWEAA